MSDLTPFPSLQDFQSAVRLARQAAQAYYDTDAQIMSDADYDLLTERIAASVAVHADWSAGNLLDAVAAGASVGGTVLHPHPMLSLAKVKTREEVEAFAVSITSGFVVEPKLDGMAVRAEYVNGVLTVLATRGDGNSGDDVLGQAHLIVGLPPRLPDPLTFEVRGEVFMTDVNFETANLNRTAAGKTAFVNPRNATAGSLRNTDATYLAPMSFAAYDTDGGPFAGVDSHRQRMALLDSFGIPSALSLLSSQLGSEGRSPLAMIDAIETLRPSLGFPIDGAVVKADSQRARDLLGSASRTPRWAIAFKYAADVATTVLRDIEVAVGRTGRISLRAVLDPVFVGGATVTYATMHNPKFVTDADFRLGDTVYVYRAGDVIPRVSAVAARGNGQPWVPPTGCPSCGEPWDTTSLLWRCHTPACSVVGRIEYAASRDVLDIEGLSTALAEAVVEAGLVADPADLFTVTVDALAALPLGDGKRTVGTATATKIVAQIANARTQPLARFITALGIRLTGRTMGRRLAAKFGSMEAFMAASERELSEVDGIGPEKARVIAAERALVAPVVAKWAGLGLPMATTESPALTSQVLPFTGKTIVVTGSVPGLDRTEAQEWVERLGGTASGSVSKKTTLVIVGEGAGSKASKAASLGVPIMEAAEFARLVNTAQAT